MGPLPLAPGPLWAVHISDGVLAGPWLTGGFALAGLLVLAAAYRVRDEEIPRIALLSSAFFVASLIHLRAGPTSVHLLLNGLVGVVLGRRAPLAIFIGLGLQAVFLGHGGFTVLGVNTCVLALPALAASWLFTVSQYLLGLRPLEGRGLTAGQLARIGVMGGGIGMLAVLATLALDAFVLLWGGAEDWHHIVWFLFYLHLPVVLIEGVVLGFTMSFLARVKPEMLGLPTEQSDVPSGAQDRWHKPAPVAENTALTPPPTDTVSSLPPPQAVQPSIPPHSPVVLVALVFTLLSARPAWAHRLDADFQVLPDRRVQIEGWFDLSEKPPVGAKVQVFRPGQRLLAEGQLDEKGTFVFSFIEPEPLEVVVNAGAGHRVALMISPEKLERSSDEAAHPLEASSRSGPSSISGRRAAWGDRLKDALLGIAFLLALSAFLLSWRNSRKLHALQRASGDPSPGEQQGGLTMDVGEKGERR
jgi:cobalt/nickel transport system permease protein